jgi:hypothetical protein
VRKRRVDIVQITRPYGLGDIANLGLTMAEGKRVLAGLQREFVAGQARHHALVYRPDCRKYGSACRVKDCRNHAVATPFGHVTLPLPPFCCAKCGRIEAGNGWPLHCRSTPELDQLQAHLSALMPFREVAEVLAQMLPLAAGKGCCRLRVHRLKPNLVRSCPATKTSITRTGLSSVTQSSRRLGKKVFYARSSHCANGSFRQTERTRRWPKRPSTISRVRSRPCKSSPDLHCSAFVQRSLLRRLRVAESINCWI